ncbi:MAG: zinc ribbon domain-containing protein [Pseudomonadota bacterium]
MPLYDYKCGDCGIFQSAASVSCFADPCTCPTCGASAPRALTVPQISTASSAVRRAHAINERSAHSPKRSKEYGLKPSGQKIRSKALQHSDGSKSLRSHRPWMLSH